MLLGSTKTAPIGDDWVLEPKWDGYRFLFELSPRGVRCWTRHGKRHDGKLRYIEEQLAEVFPHGAVLDGELVALGRDEHGEVRHDFGRIGAVLGASYPHQPGADKPALHFVAFDLLGLEGRDLRDSPWLERREALDAHFDSSRENVSLTDTLPASEECHERLIAAGFEGSVYKRRDSRYASGRRSTSWLKRKARHELEVVLRHLVRDGGRVERAGCAIPASDGRLVGVGWAEVWDPLVRDALACAATAHEPTRAKVCFSSYSARGELRETRVTELSSQQA